MAIEQARKYQPRHRDAGVVRPAETPPDLVTRLLLRRVIRRGPADRVQPDREITLRDLGEHRMETRIIHGNTAHVGAELNAGRAECLGPRDLGYSSVDVMQR